VRRTAQLGRREAALQALVEQRTAELREASTTDPLTGLRNRRYVDEVLPGLIAAGGELTVAIVDLDHFKWINDRLSHDIGDQVLVLVAKLLETELAAVSPDGFIARMGGEEFLVVLPGTDVPEAAEQLDDIRRAVGSYAWSEITGSLPVTISVGVAGRWEASAAGQPAQPALLSVADRNRYFAKRGGRDRVVAGAAHSYRDTSAA
jgi:diguanylate cyclase (GGDEF)-like protein